MLIADSLEALAGRDGEQVLTEAPAVVLSGRPAVEAIDARLDRATADAIIAVLSRTARTIFTVLEANGLAGEARLAAMQVEFDTRGVFEAAMLGDAELTEPVTVLRLKTGDATYDERFNGPWTALLAANRNLAEEVVTVTPTAERHGFGSEPPSLALRLALAPAGRLVVSLASRLARLLPAVAWRRRVGVVSRNELVDDALAGLALRGYLAVPVALPVRATPLADATADEAVAAAFAVYGEALAPFIHEKVLPALLAMRLEKLLAACRAYRGARAALATMGLPPVAAILTNAPLSPAHVALAEAAANAGIPFIGVQHGIGTEIADTAAFRHSIAESTICRHVLTFNAAAAKAATANPFAAGKVVATGCGLTSTHAGERRFRALRAGDRAIYVSTLLYRGYVQNRPFYAADSELARLEGVILDEVLDGLPYPVDFKPYPALRFPDDDPVLARVRASRSVGMVGTHTDLRYIVGRYRLVIAGAATSTIGWCLAAGVPFVYFDHYAIGRLSEEARVYIAAGAFYFDLEAPAGMAALRAFLDRPLTGIENEWRAKAAARARLNKFLGADRASAASAAARAVIKAIRDVRVERTAQITNP